MAKQLFDYWFLQFDFPNEDGKPYKSSGGKMQYDNILNRNIPAHWSVTRLSDIITSNRGISYNTESISGGGIPMINLASFNTDGSYKHAGLKTYNGNYTEDKILHPFDLVMCNTQQTALDPAKDIIGKAFLVPNLFDEDIVSSHHVTTIKTSKSNLNAYLAYLTNTPHFHKYASGCCSGTNIMGLNFSTLIQCHIELPTDDVLLEFENRIRKIETPKYTLIKENINLEKMRNELLPLLMSGQVSVTQLNSDLSAC